MRGALGFFLALLAAGSISVAVVLLPRRRLAPVVSNHRGIPLPLILGPAFAAGLILVLVADFLIEWGAGNLDAAAWRPLVVILALLLVFAFGLLDDYRAGPGRGLMGHFAELFHGRVTTGIGKLAAAVAGSWLATAALGADGIRLALAVPFVAGTANLWNLLDLQPGRALKYFVLAMGGLALVDWRFALHLHLVPAALGSGLAVLPFDLRERAMLGDSGANAMGFVVGVASYRLLPTWGLAVGLAGILLLHLLAETVTLSRLIEATPPLRWFDRLGRLPLDQAKPESSPSTPDSSAT